MRAGVCLCGKSRGGECWQSALFWRCCVTFGGCETSPSYLKKKKGFKIHPRYCDGVLQTDIMLLRVCRYPDLGVREFAAESLARIPSDDLVHFLPQLIQVSSLSLPVTATLWCDCVPAWMNTHTNIQIKPPGR